MKFMENDLRKKRYNGIGTYLFDSVLDIWKNERMIIANKIFWRSEYAIFSTGLL